MSYLFLFILFINNRLVNTPNIFIILNKRFLFLFYIIGYFSNKNVLIMNKNIFMVVYFNYNLYMIL